MIHKIVDCIHMPIEFYQISWPHVSRLRYMYHIVFVSSILPDVNIWFVAQASIFIS